MNVVSNIKPFQAKETINDILGGKEIYLEYTDEIENQTTEKKVIWHISKQRKWTL